MNQTLKVFKALADETRLRIFNLLIERDCCVCEVVQALGISQTSASRGLTQLHEAGLAEQRKEGLWVIYYLPDDRETNGLNLIVEAVGRRLAEDPQATTDRQKLRENGRLCPPEKIHAGRQPADCATPEPGA